ncbi:unnamed protein product [Mucor hiemalis]
MYSSNQQDFHMENTDTMFVNNQPRTRTSLNQQQSPTYHHHHNNNFGPMAINPSSTVSSGHGSVPFTDPSTNWFGHLIDGFAGGDDDELSQRNHQEMFEKRRRRRESHNAVERRRRDNINERIQELSTLLPDHLLESVPASSNVMSVATGQNGANGKPINKGTILKLSVDHIKELREEVTNCKGKIAELERLIELAKRGESIDGHRLKQEDNNMELYQQQVMHNLMNQHNGNNVGSGGSGGRPRHERVGSIQFQQQFGKLHINGGDEQQQQHQQA